MGVGIILTEEVKGRVLWKVRVRNNLLVIFNIEGGIDLLGIGIENGNLVRCEFADKCEARMVIGV